MDDFQMEGDTLKDALNRIASINRLLGGNRVTLEGVKQLLQHIPDNREVSITDVGCGNGDMLRMLADYGRRRQQPFKLLGIDANPFTLQYAASLSKDYPDIGYECMDVLSAPFAELRYDIVLCTLTLHHFNEQQMMHLLRIFQQRAGVGAVINDLHRSSVAYRLFQLICRIFRLNEMSRKDGLVSILRGFKKEELQELATRLHIDHYRLRWKWAFRYQWIIYNT
jgi:2-polyprenyl-3-methyl-5-hydroxy-6-metoxy-1,4-benzoquinol methylase